MGRRLLITLLPLGVALVVASPALAGGNQNASVKLVECQPTGDMPSAEFLARMRVHSGTRRMALRFVLQERAAGGGWQTVEYGPLEEWRRSRPLVRTFSYRQRVANLDPTLAYRVIVRFRWSDDGGPPLESAARRSPECAPPPPL